MYPADCPTPSGYSPSIDCDILSGFARKQTDEVNTKQLGDTGVLLPEIGLGTWRYTGGVTPLRRGIELGAFLIDTAEAYGTEGVVGEAVQDIRDRVFIATKVSPRNFRRNDVRQAADRSLQRLRIDYIDLYQLHWPNSSIPVAETMSAMEDLVDAGKVRFIGVSNFSVAELEEAQDVMTRHRIVSNQVLYNLAERDIEEELLSYCQQRGITVIAYSPLAKGLNNLRAADARGVLPQIASRLGKTEAQVALNWCIAHDGVIAIPKADSIRHTEENCAASGWTLSPEDVALLESAFPF